MAGNESNQESRAQFKLERLQNRRLLSAVLDLDAPVEEPVAETAPEEVIQFSDGVEIGNPDEIFYSTMVDLVDPVCGTVANDQVIESNVDPELGDPAPSYIFECEILTVEETGEEAPVSTEETVDPELGDPGPIRTMEYEVEILVLDENGEILEATGGIAPNQRGGVEILDDVVTTMSNEIYETAGPAVETPVVEELAQAAPPAAATQLTGSGSSSGDLLKSKDDDLLNTGEASLI